MTRIVPQHPTLATHSLSHLVLAVVALLLAASVADAAPTTGKCLVQKHLAWDNLRSCQRKAQVKQLKGKPTDFATCQTKFQAKIATISANAAKASIPCRYGANGDGTVTDYDTGLMWEQKTVGLGGMCLFVPLGESSHCVSDKFLWADAQGFVSGASTDGTAVPSFLAGYTDWRLPTITELRAIVDPTVPGCGSGSPCIDPIFGLTVANFYWSATIYPALPDSAWAVNFDTGVVGHRFESSEFAVRAVRTGL